MKINSSGITELANTSFTPALVESRIKTDYIDWQTDGAVILKNSVKLSGSGITSLNSFYYLTDQWLDYNTVVSYGASGSFSVPTGVYNIGVVLFGGGGGGQSTVSVTTTVGESTTTSYYTGANGGLGGFGFEKLSVLPSDTITYTIGAGGTGGAAYNGAGTVGGSSTLTYGTFTMTVTGGASGGAGGASGTYKGVQSGLFSYAPIQAVYENQVSFNVTNPLASQASLRAVTDRNPVAYDSAGLYMMGAGGEGGTGTLTLRNGDGGVGGGILFFYMAP